VAAPSILLAGKAVALDKVEIAGQGDRGLQEFIQLYEDEFGEYISLEEARVMATGLLELYEALAKLLPEEEMSATEVVSIPV
jgi:hypothetical protein